MPKLAGRLGANEVMSILSNGYPMTSWSVCMHVLQSMYCQVGAKHPALSVWKLRQPGVELSRPPSEVHTSILVMELGTVTREIKAPLNAPF